jgi:hypothetical protein
VKVTSAETKLAATKAKLKTANESLATAVSTRDAAEAKLDKAKTNLTDKFATFEAARDARIQAESYLKDPKGSPSLTEVITAPIPGGGGETYQGHASGQKLFDARKVTTGKSAWSAATRTTQEQRWDITKATVEQLAKGGKLDSYVEFRSNRGGTRTLGAGQTRVGGNDFW